jgi:hypothetical protein
MEAMCPEQSSLGSTASHDLYEVRPRKDREGIDLISELFRYGPIWYAGPDAVRNAIAYAKYAPTPGPSGQLSAWWTTPAL